MSWSLQKTPELSDLQFEQWNRLLEERTGIQVAPHQRGYLQMQLTARMRELGINHYGHYFNEVSAGLKGMVEWLILVDRLLVKETRFFRHRDSLEAVRRLVQTRINNQQLHENFEAWSLGCATGEEPYSLAMVINDCFALAGLEPLFGITATDVSQPSLQRAREGVYSERRLEPLTDSERRRYFRAVSPGEQSWQVIAGIRERVCFSYGNVLQVADMPLVPMDVIYCQNLLIYFRRWRRREILNELARRLKPGGMLVIGLGEVIDWVHPDLQRVADDRVQAYVRRR